MAKLKSVKAIEKTEGKPIGLVILVVILTLIIGGGALGYGGYYYVQKKTKSDQEAMEKQITDLKTQVAKLKKDLKTWQDKVEGTCADTLTDEEKITIENWKTYTNNRYKFSFRYPDSFVIKTNEDDRLVMTSSGDGANFEFLSRDASIRGYEGYKSISEKSIEIACVKSTRIYIRGDQNLGTDKTHRVIYAQFSRSNIPHLLVLSFTSRGASFDADLLEMFELMAKTVTFK